ncbi:FAD-dependent oxidoreductase [Microvirga makkahensis]|uniref:FAD-dependent oxidoreductase n=1 Tax=Microvirga makkahensis TaxID=1128670 RepID=A0A7X3SN03_9HYPH|nr:FAD-dependent oxidoreductase [Microvirga makkahensis]MXQ10549.1 FAD-dependent oxidoreductase [Microvirga makkahensis]
MRTPLRELDGRSFDVVVVGGGAVGASAAQHIAANGHKTLLVDKGDFGSGTSSRSSRLLYSGLAYFSPDYELWRFAYRPSDLFQRVRMARLAMRCRTELASTMPERVSRHTFFFPVFEDGEYPAWKVDLGYRALGLFGSRKVPLSYRRLPADEAARQFGLVSLMDRSRLSSVAVFDEYQYQWAERICLDTILDAERCGSLIRNYTAVTQLDPIPGGGWQVRLEDSTAPDQTATVKAQVVVNSAGPWADRLLRQTTRQAPRKKHLVGIKGVNLVVKLPESCRGTGFEMINSIGQPFYCMPWGDYHFFGPTETIFEDDPDSVRVLPEEVDFILGEANRALPSLKLAKDDIVYRWAGVRPRTTSEAASGVKALTIHDMAAEGMPGVLTVTGCPIMTHRHAGRTVAARVAKMSRPTGDRALLSYAAKTSPGGGPLSRERLRHAAAHEHVQTLVDLLFRRVLVGWTADMGLAQAREAAETVADVMGWDAARITQEVEAYRAFVAKNFEPQALTEQPGSTKVSAL